MPKKSTAPTKTPKDIQVVPDWAKKVKVYREEAGISQGDIQKAFKTKFNTMSPVETGRRKFTPSERKQFFELIGKGEDPSIPTSDRDTVLSAPKAVKAAKKPAKAAKTQKAAKAPKAEVALLTPSAPVSEESAPVSVPNGDVKAPAAPATEPKAHVRRGRIPSTPADSPVAPALKQIRQPGKGKFTKAASTPSVAAQPIPIKAAAHAPVSEISPVKEAVIRDISRILSNPGLSDSQAKALHNLFTSLAVNALLGA